MEKAIEKLQTGGSSRMAASQRLETVTSLCTDWLATCGISPTSIHSYSRGYLQSRRWEQRSSPKGDKVSSTVLQATLVPCSATAPYHDGFRPCYRVWVYSLLKETETEKLKQKLQSITGRGGLVLSLFWKKAQCYERLL